MIRIPSDDSDSLTVAQTARLLGLSPERVRQLEREGKLAAEWTPYGRIFQRSEVERFQAERQGKS